VAVFRGPKGVVSVKDFSGFEGVLRKRINSSRHFRHGFLVARANPRHRRRVATRNCETPRTNTQRKLLLSYLVNCLFSLASRSSKIHIITVRTERHHVVFREVDEKGERFEDRALKGIRLLRWWSFVSVSFVSVSCLGAREGLPSSLPLEWSHSEWEPRRFRRRPGPLTRTIVWTECNSSSCVRRVAGRRDQILGNMWMVNNPEAVGVKPNEFCPIFTSI